MKKIIFAVLTILFTFLFPANASADHTFWRIQSIDTMKYSRDLAREMINNESFATEIEFQVSEIAKAGATHIAIGTPYDEEFIPFLSKWVLAARKNNLKVWFRGNFSGWEGWFNYPRITQTEHLLALGAFIAKNKNLFEEGDIFTPCTECENGGPGDPRQTRDIEGFRNFLIVERETAIRAFEQIGKKVEVGYFSMNGDVARLVMDKATTHKLGGIVVIDHYVESTDDLSRDIEETAKLSGGKVVLGEFGAPIPDIHGRMTSLEQNVWLEKALSTLSQSPSLVGLNYWVFKGGSTEVWNGEGKKPALLTIASFFNPKHLDLKVVDAVKRPVENADVLIDEATAFTNKDGVLSTEIAPKIKKITIKKEGFKTQTIDVSADDSFVVILEMETEPWWFKIRKLLVKLFSR